ncbi:hypothetical protein JOM56_014213 [Amanita muscaria]
MSGKRKAHSNTASNSVPPATQPTSKRKRTSTPFRVARGSTVVNRTSRLTTIRTNARGRRGYLTEGRRPDPSPSVNKELSDDAVPDPPLPDLRQLDNDPGTSVPPQPPKPKRTRQNTTSTKLLEWLIFRQSCLDELLQQDGLADSLDHELCISCKKLDGMYKCKDCFSGGLLRCRDCLVNAHQDHPLHRIEIWNGRFFAVLGHGGASCPLPSTGPANFCIFDTSGIHYISVNFCDCRIIHQRTQLLRARWFPATFNRPKTAFTFDCLDTFHELTLQGKTPLYDFYHTVLHKTDNLELHKTIYRYPEFHRVFRIWRNLLMLKRAGRGQDPAGAGATAQGELALAGPLLYLKGKDRGINDPELAPGWASFIEEGRYQEHIMQHVDQSEINTCQSEHDALVRAAVRCTPGYSVMGTGLCVCARHCLVRKNGVGDLQKGERYCNMDYIILSSLAGVKLPRVVITYDIGCQWSKNFWRRVEEFPDDLKLDPATSVEVGIPSWHINGHGDNCRTFCLNYMDGVGRTCGEEVETTWAQTNALGTSTREMGPGARHETLNDQWCGWNFRKIVGFRSFFLKRLKEAFAMRDKQRLIFQQFLLMFPPQTVKEWEAMVLEWRNDRSKPNPYKEPAPSTTLQDVRLALAKEEAAEAARGRISPHKVTQTTFLTMALDLEEQQRHLRLEVSQIKGTQTSKQLADLEEKRTSLRNRIQCWRQAQLVYTPCVAALIMTTVLEKECRLRIAQADDALAEIRRQRRIVSGLWQFKKLNVDGTGNKACTRMRTLYNRFNLRTQRCADCYRVARSALLILDPNGRWQSCLKDLRDNDIRGPGKDDNGSGNRRYEPSWIWLVPPAHSMPEMGDSEQVPDDSLLRVEWAKAQARKQRWEEEVILIQEEMRRVVMFHDQAACRSDADRTYAEKQAHLCESLARGCVTSWLPTLKGNGITTDWEGHYSFIPAAADVCCVSSTDEEVDSDDESVEEIDDGGRSDNLDIDLFEVDD